MCLNKSRLVWSSEEPEVYENKAYSIVDMLGVANTFLDFSQVSIYDLTNKVCGH